MTNTTNPDAEAQIEQAKAVQPTSGAVATVDRAAEEKAADSLLEAEDEKPTDEFARYVEKLNKTEAEYIARIPKEDIVDTLEEWLDNPKPFEMLKPQAFTDREVKDAWAIKMTAMQSNPNSRWEDYKRLEPLETLIRLPDDGAVLTSSGSRGRPWDIGHLVYKRDGVFHSVPLSKAQIREFQDAKGNASGAIKAKLKTLGFMVYELFHQNVLHLTAAFHELSEKK